MGSPSEAKNCLDVIHQVSNEAIFIMIETKGDVNEANNLAHRENSITIGVNNLVREEKSIANEANNIVNGKELHCG
ncbi:MAG: hypothetical protein KZQ75_11135 [Candidatus Thiodiazotropha sp. (ex Myrtea spinifera)]|nr:hypothetical protein [Candidatus Thiodiazotropha sp. (ex Myrtea spinifera)]MCU7827919.1 hypothetical protein [Candidatus Thiodiazotropha sp. (ex Myrtea sp. 'scaly one' KF741663)]